MHVDPALHSKSDGYTLSTNLVVPRPIAWITTLNNSGTINLAPFSFFNAVGSDPLYVVISIGHRDGGSPKDTARTILDGGEFVVNMVTEELITAMNASAADFPPGESELTATGLSALPSLRVKVPRLADAQASLECRLFQSLPLGANTLVIGEVMMFHVPDRLISPGLHISSFAPIGRLGSPSVYCRTTDRFELPRLTYDQWRERV
jgi:flavin reductase (DIM6/NTAB) family NADH-FMN oxidoreductase RutF